MVVALHHAGVAIADRISHLDIELATLRQTTEPATPNDGLALTDTIVAVVRNSPTAMHPVRVTATRSSDGTTTDLKTVASTMHYLTTQGRLTKTGRGQYIAV